jgi:hypothetical protein
MKTVHAATIGMVLLTGTSGIVGGQQGKGGMAPGIGAQYPQQNTSPMSPRGGIGLPPNGLPSIDGHDLSNNPLGPRLEEQQAKTRNTERQKRLVADTNKLLALVADLKQQLETTNKDAASVDVVKKTEEIEKLAKSVKDRMKG